MTGARIGWALGEERPGAHWASLGLLASEELLAVVGAEQENEAADVGA
jgi:hypothetical protein